jgi:hypothetical protein
LEPEDVLNVRVQESMMVYVAAYVTEQADVFFVWERENMKDIKGDM